MSLSQAEKDRAKEIKRIGLTILENYYHPILKDPSKTFRQTVEPFQMKNFVDPEFNPMINRIVEETGRDYDKAGLVAAMKFSKHIANDAINARPDSIKMPMRTRVHASEGSVR